MATTGLKLILTDQDGNVLDQIAISVSDWRIAQDKAICAATILWDLAAGPLED